MYMVKGNIARNGETQHCEHSIWKQKVDKVFTNSGIWINNLFKKFIK